MDVIFPPIRNFSFSQCYGMAIEMPSMAFGDAHIGGSVRTLWFQSHMFRMEMHFHFCQLWDTRKQWENKSVHQVNGQMSKQNWIFRTAFPVHRLHECETQGVCLTVVFSFCLNRIHTHTHFIPPYSVLLCECSSFAERFCFVALWHWVIKTFHTIIINRTLKLYICTYIGIFDHNV